MSLINRKKAIVLIFSILLISGVVLFTTRKQNKPEIPNSPQLEQVVTDKLQDESIGVDFDGDGKSETVNVKEIEKNRVNMIAYNSEGKIIAELWDGMTLYPTTLYKVINLNTKSPKQYLQWNMATGPHQVETVFLTIIKDKIHPIYSFDFDKNTMYSPFYTSRGQIVVEDANLDGLKEVIENVDEYPVNSPRLEDPKIEDMIRQEFSKNGLNEEAIQGNIKIVTRENYGKGRGRKVIMAIHSFVDASTPFFRRLPTAEYEKIAGPLIAASIEIEKGPDDTTNHWEDQRYLRYSELEVDSKNFNDFVRDFWTHGRIYELPLSGETTSNNL